jgi:hypothetical protein
MDPAKVKAIHEWEPPTCVCDVKCFLGFANFYWRFIHRYSQKCRLLYDLLRKDTPFAWTAAHSQVFNKFKEAFCSAPILRHFDPALETIVATDASDFAAAGVLSQRFPEGDSLVLHLVACYSRKLTPAECNYSIGDKDLLAIVIAFEEWRPHLLGAEKPVLVLIDHNNLQGFLTKKLLNRRQACWALELSEYNFKIVYRPGSKNAKADALTQRSGDFPKEGDGRGRPVDNVLKPENFDSASFGHVLENLVSIGDPASLAPDDPASLAFDDHTLLNAICAISISAITQFQLSSTSRSFTSAIREAPPNDSLGQEIIRALRDKDQRHPKVALSECEYKDDLLFVNGLLYVPNNEDLQAKIIHHGHDHPAACHPGRAATYELVSRNSWWPGMRKTIARYLRNSNTCARIKPARHVSYGFLKPLPIPQRRWESVSMDFIVGLPESSGFNLILVVVNRLSKMAHFIPTTNTVDSEGTVALY